MIGSTQPVLSFHVGIGYDVHRFVEGCDLYLGGIKIEHTLGLLRYSDTDVLIHVICDALLGAANTYDIGYHFPDASADMLDMDSKVILRKTIDLLVAEDYRVRDVDATVCVECPKINPHTSAMCRCLPDTIGCDIDAVPIKVITSERMDFVGREGGMAAYVVYMIVEA